MWGGRGIVSGNWLLYFVLSIPALLFDSQHNFVGRESGVRGSAVLL